MLARNTIAVVASVVREMQTLESYIGVLTCTYVILAFCIFLGAVTLLKRYGIDSPHGLIYVSYFWNTAQQTWRCEELLSPTPKLNFPVFISSTSAGGLFVLYSLSFSNLLPHRSLPHWHTVSVADDVRING